MTPRLVKDFGIRAAMEIADAERRQSYIDYPPRLDGRINHPPRPECGHTIDRPVYAFSPTAGFVAIHHHECDTCRPSEDQ